MTGILTSDQVSFPVQLYRLKHHSRQISYIFMWKVCVLLVLVPHHNILFSVKYVYVDFPLIVS